MLFLCSFIQLAKSTFKPIITQCSVKSIGYQHTVTLYWTLLNEYDIIKIREYWISCNCSDYELDYTKVCVFEIYVCKEFILCDVQYFVSVHISKSNIKEEESI